MKIPGASGEFGNSVASAPQAVNIPALSNGQGLQAIGGTIQQIANQEGAQNRERLEASQRARAALTLATTSNDMQDAHDAVSRGVMDGSIPADQAVNEFNSRSRKISESNLSGVLTEQREQMAPQLANLNGSLTRNLNGVVVRRQQQETGAVIDQFGEQVSREAPRLGPTWASQKFDAMVDFTGAAAGWTPAQMAGKKQAFKESTTFNFLDAAGTDALTRGDVAGVTNVLKKVQGEDGDVLDPLKRVRLTHQLFGYQQHLLAKQARDDNAAEEAQRLRDNAAVDFTNAAGDLIQQGKAFSADYIKQGSELTAGTRMEATWAGQLSAQALGSGFATKSQAERDALLTMWEADQTNPKVGTDPAQAKAISVLRTMNDKLTSAAKDNPWQAAAASGKVPATPQIDATTGPAAIGIIQDRMKTIGAVENWVGHKVSPLQPQEVEQIGKMVRTLPVDQAASMLGSMGDALGNDERVAALAKQMHDKDGTLGLAMIYASSQTTQGRYTAELVLRGEQALKDKVVTVDGANETGWKATIAKEVRGVFSNREAEDAYVDAAFKIAAAKYAQNGSADVPEAIKLATGGIVERNGGKVPLPYGVKEDEFNKRIDATKMSDLISQVPDGRVLVGRTSMPLQEFVATIPKATLVDAGPGSYAVRAGTAFVTNTAGKRIVLKVSP